VRLEANEQISHAPGNLVTVLGGGLLDVNTRTETLANLMVSGGGDVAVETGGKLSVSDAVVSGQGSTLTNAFGSKLYVGEVAHGALEIKDRGLVTSSGPAFIGYESGATGEVTVNGGGSKWDASSLYLGYRGSSVLNITDGGVVNGGGTIGSLAGSAGVVNVDGEGSAWNMAHNSSLFLGYQGSANVNVTRGGDVVSGDTTIGFYPGSLGAVSVDGLGSSWYSAGDIEIAIGKLAVTGQGQVASALPLLVESLGTLSGNSVVSSDFVYNGGLVAPGPFAGALTVNGNYIQQPAGKLEIELGGMNNFDQLLVPTAGTIASLDGTLQVKLIGGFTPLVGQTFTILSAYDVDGEFAAVQLPSIPGRRFDVIYNPQSVVLRVALDLGGAAHAIPEPTALMMISVAGCGLALRRRRRGSR
jgi:T5SS/PEP-CTERM-associated repeat protein